MTFVNKSTPKRKKRRIAPLGVLYVLFSARELDPAAIPTVWGLVASLEMSQRESEKAPGKAHGKVGTPEMFAKKKKSTFSVSSRDCSARERRRSL
jgi:hypothetical protein